MSLFVLFMQKTAYEMRISDWSSDVCSSDLRHGAALVVDPRAGAALHRGRDDPPRPRAGPPRPVPAAAPSFVHRLAGDFPRLCAVPGRLAVAGGDAAGGAGVPVAHPGRGAGAARGVPEALCSVCARDETAGPVRLDRKSTRLNSSH